MGINIESNLRGNNETKKSSIINNIRSLFKESSFSRKAKISNEKDDWKGVRVTVGDVFPKVEKPEFSAEERSPDVRIEISDGKEVTEGFPYMEPDYSRLGFFDDGGLNRFIAGLCESRLMTKEERFFSEQIWDLIFRGKDLGGGLQNIREGIFCMIQENLDDTKSKLYLNVKPLRINSDNKLIWLMYIHEEDKFFVSYNTNKGIDEFQLYIDNNSSQRFIEAIQEESNKNKIVFEYH